MGGKVRTLFIYLKVQTAFLNSVVITHRFVNTNFFPLPISTEAAFKNKFPLKDQVLLKTLPIIIIHKKK